MQRRLPPNRFHICVLARLWLFRKKSKLLNRLSPCTDWLMSVPYQQSAYFVAKLMEAPDTLNLSYWAGKWSDFQIRCILHLPSLWTILKLFFQIVSSFSFLISQIQVITNGEFWLSNGFYNELVKLGNKNLHCQLDGSQTCSRCCYECLHADFVTRLLVTVPAFLLSFLPSSSSLP